MSEILPMIQKQQKTPHEITQKHTSNDSHALLTMSKALDAMMQKDFDLDKFERLASLRDKEIERQNKKLLHESLSLAQSQIKAIEKDQTNVFLRTQYSSLNKTLEKVKPILSSYGFSVVTTVENQTNNSITLKTSLLHECGEISQSLTLPLDGVGKDGRTNKNVIQSIGSTITYGRRYLLNMLLNISNINEDTDGRIEGYSPPCSVEQHQEIINLITQTNTDVAKLLAHTAIENLDNLTVNQAEILKGLLKNKQKKLLHEAEQKNTPTIHESSSAK